MHNDARSGATGELGVHLALFAVQLAFASGALAGKVALHREGVDPTALAFIRAAAGALAFLVAERVTRKGPVEPLPKAPMIAFAFLGVVINQAFFLHGLRRGTATSAALLSATIPVFTAALGIVVGLERPRLSTWLGIAIATGGVLGLTGVRDISLGNLLVTINSFSYAIYLVAVGKYVRRYGALRVVGAAFAWGALVLAIPGVPKVIHPTWSSTGWLYVGWFVLVPTIFAYVTNAWALGRARPSIVAAYIYLQPLLVIAVAGSWLGERLDARTLFAGAAILLGLGIVVVGKNGSAPRLEGASAAIADQTVRPDQASAVRPDQASAVRPDQASAVRPDQASK